MLGDLEQKEFIKNFEAPGSFLRVNENGYVAGEDNIMSFVGRNMDEVLG